MMDVQVEEISTLNIRLEEIDIKFYHQKSILI